MLKTSRIALVLASIHTGASNELWSEIAKQAERSGDVLIVFPGGRLECQENQEYLRNAIYPLVNSENVGAIITWASALGGSVSVEEVRAFLATMDPLPCVCIGMKREGFPAVSFDAYSGVQSVMLHCIKEHHAKRIAFLRGPENHYSAIDRYRAYCESLEQTGLVFDPRLISDPYGWTEGSKAVHQLIHERSLVPGKDFDTLVCSSDLMMFDAGKYLESEGYVIPDDLRIVGYNDSRESHLLKVPCTTARLPVIDLARMSWNLVENLLSEGISSCFDILLPSHPVIRRSCGCSYSLGGIDEARLHVGTKKQFLSWLIQSFEVKEENQKSIYRMLDLLEGEDEQAALSLLEKLSYRFLDNNGDPNLLSEALHWYSVFHCSLYFKERLGSSIRDLFLRQRDLVAHEHAYALSEQTKILNALKCDLLGIRELGAIAQVLSAHLPKLGIDRGYLVLHEDDQRSLFIGGYSDSNLLRSQQSFSKQLLLPPQLLDSLEQGVYVTEPLFMDSQPLGYLIVRTRLFNGSVMEELRTALSSAIKGAFLLDAANRAREESERAQRARSEFFANISEGLRGPLEMIVSLLDKESEQLQQKVHQQVRTAQHLLDLTFSHTGELSFEPRICEITDLLNEIPDTYVGPMQLPVILADPSRLQQSFEIICDHIRKDAGAVRAEVQIQLQGLLVQFSSLRTAYKAAMGKQDLSLSLAQRILLMSGAMVHFEDNGIIVSFPWPSFQGLASTPIEQGPLYVLGEGEQGVPDLFADFSGIQTIKASLLGTIGLQQLSGTVLLWDGMRKTVDLQLGLHQLMQHSQLSTLPIICFNVPKGYTSLFSALTAAKQMDGFHAVVAVCGSLGMTLLHSLDLSNCSVPCNPVDLPELCEHQKVNLLLSDLCNPSLFVRLRKTSPVPIVLIREAWTAEEIEQLSQIPRLILVHHCVEESFDFQARLLDIFYRQDVLPPLTGALVKRALLYLQVHAKAQISRWQLAESVNVSEDYLTRIFHKEIGLSPWEYLNRYRIHLAERLLKMSTLTINEVASQTGFQDQAYFCRVFRKIKGCAPSAVRSNQ